MYLLQAERDAEAAILGRVNPSKQVLAGVFDQGTAILTGIAGNRQMIKVSSKGDDGVTGMEEYFGTLCAAS